MKNPEIRILPVPDKALIALGGIHSFFRSMRLSTGSIAPGNEDASCVMLLMTLLKKHRREVDAIVEPALINFFDGSLIPVGRRMQHYMIEHPDINEVQAFRFGFMYAMASVEEELSKPRDVQMTERMGDLIRIWFADMDLTVMPVADDAIEDMEGLCDQADFVLNTVAFEIPTVPLAIFGKQAGAQPELVGSDAFETLPNPWLDSVRHEYVKAQKFIRDGLAKDASKATSNVMSANPADLLPVPKL